MKYSDIIGLQEYFHPVFNIENEAINYWKQFIPNEQFYEVLRKVLSAIDTNEPSLRKSIWIQGTFGTGKSHAASVIKHLLTDEDNEVIDYIKDRIDDTSLKSRLTSYRGKIRLIPIVLKGIGSITNSRTFSLQIEKAIKTSPIFKELGIVTASDFDRLIEQVNSPLIDWESLIKKHVELSIYVSSKNDILKKLNAYDIDFFQILEETLITKEGWFFSHADISSWLVELKDEIVARGKADGIIFLWDEFTLVMDSINSGIINQIQNIAELSEKSNIFLYLISHRTPQQHTIPNEDLTRLNDRFHVMQYRMEPITTYHIIAASIKKKDIKKWRTYQNEIYGKSPQWDELIAKLTNNNSASVKSQIKDLFPIHPYSAYLSVFIARNIGSTNRSIFGFLYDKEYGFLNYLNKDIKKERLLTVDYLWDFFMSAFESDQEARFNQVIEKYRLHIQRVKEKGQSYLKVFKGILLLNVLFKVTAREEEIYVNPSTENITSLFTGCDFENELPEILSYIDENGIVNQTPLGDFLIEFSTLPAKEIEIAKEGVRNQFKDIISVLKHTKIDKEIDKVIFKDNIYREVEVAMFSTNIGNEHILTNRLNNSFSKSYTIKLAVFYPVSENDSLSTLNTIKDLARGEDFQNVIFIIVDEPFSDKNFEKFIEYIARRQVSDNHSYAEQSITFEGYAKDLVVDWYLRIKSSYFQIYFRDKEGKNLSSQIGSTINQEYSPAIFYKGIDSIPDIFKNAAFWKFQSSKNALESFIFSNDRNELEEKIKSGINIYLKALIKNQEGEYIVTDSLALKTDSDSNHSLYVIQNEVDIKLTELKQRSQFNIGDELKFLIEPPYGLYTNTPNMALLAFVMRKYIGELYVADVGRPIEKDEMRDLIIYMFNYWQENKSQTKLNVRFGSKEEGELKKLLFELFDLKDFNSITDTRWAIINYCKTTAKYPLWSLKYYTDDKNLVLAIDELLKLIHNSTNIIDAKLISGVLEKVQDHSYELKLALKPDNFRLGFLTFLQGVDDNILINENNFNELVDFLILNMQEEIGLWKEDNVKLKIYQWYTHKNPPITGPIPPTPGPNPPLDPNPPIPGDEEKEKIINKVQNFNLGEQEIKNRILQLLKENPQLLNIIDKYFS